jgi:hypothetical protein
VPRAKVVRVVWERKLCLFAAHFRVMVGTATACKGLGSGGRETVAYLLLALSAAAMYFFLAFRMYSRNPTMPSFMRCEQSE